MLPILTLKRFLHSCTLYLQSQTCETWMGWVGYKVDNKLLEH